jgi:hypothetical protein
VIKFSIAAAALTIGMIFSFSATAQTAPGSGAPSATGASSDPFSSAAGTSTNSTNTRPKKPDSTDTSDSSDTDDDSLYREKTKDSLASGAMSRDEGQLTRKPRKKEKVSVVDSTKKLPTSGTDPKFQGSLLHSSVTSIDYVGEKANDEADAANEEAVPHFKKRHRVFTPEKSEESTKKETPRTEAVSSPSPTPSPTASPSAPKR